MSVWVRQVEGGDVTDERQLERPDAFASDADYLAAKEASHRANGWRVKASGAGFVATKRRHGGVATTREFGID